VDRLEETTHRSGSERRYLEGAAGKESQERDEKRKRKNEIEESAKDCSSAWVLGFGVWVGGAGGGGGLWVVFLGVFFCLVGGWGCCRFCMGFVCVGGLWLWVVGVKTANATRADANSTTNGARVHRNGGHHNTGCRRIQRVVTPGRGAGDWRHKIYRRNHPPAPVKLMFRDQPRIKSGNLQDS